MPYNKNTYIKVENLIELSGKHFNKLYDSNKFRKTTEDNYSELIKLATSEIDYVEGMNKTFCVCSECCNYCCQQAILLNEFEIKILKKHLLKLIAPNQVIELRNQITNVCNILKNNNIKSKISLFEAEEVCKKYRKLNIMCPFNNKEDLCDIYNFRPFTCWTHRNYGDKIDCQNTSAPHTYSYIEAERCIKSESMLMEEFLSGYMLLPYAIQEILES